MSQFLFYRSLRIRDRGSPRQGFIPDRRAVLLGRARPRGEVRQRLQGSVRARGRTSGRPDVQDPEDGPREEDLPQRPEARRRVQGVAGGLPLQRTEEEE